MAVKLIEQVSQRLDIVVMEKNWSRILTSATQNHFLRNPVTYNYESCSKICDAKTSFIKISKCVGFLIQHIPE